MSDLVLLVLTTDFKDGASIGLDVAKKLDREGWIELMDYTLFEKDEKGHLSIRRSDDEILEEVSAATVGIGGGVMGGALGGPAGAAAGSAAGALIGMGFARHMEGVEHEQLLKSALSAALPQNSSTLALLIEERYADRLEERFEKVGRTVVRSLNRAECDAELDAYLHRSQEKIRLLEEHVNAQSAALHSCAEADKIRVQKELAATKTELQIVRDKLMDHLQAMSADLYAEIREMNARLAVAGRAAGPQIAACVDHLQRELDQLTDQLEKLLEDRIKIFETEAAELRLRASNAAGELKVAIEAHALDVESLLRKERDDLGDSFEERLLQTRQWLQVLRVRAALANSDVRSKQRDVIDRAQRALEEVKALVRMRHRENEEARKDARQRFSNVRKELADTFDRAPQR